MKCKFSKNILIFASSRPFFFKHNKKQSSIVLLLLGSLLLHVFLVFQLLKSWIWCSFFFVSLSLSPNKLKTPSEPTTIFGNEKKTKRKTKPQRSKNFLLIWSTLFYKEGHRNRNETCFDYWKKKYQVSRTFNSCFLSRFITSTEKKRKYDGAQILRKHSKRKRSAKVERYKYVYQ